MTEYKIKQVVAAYPPENETVCYYQKRKDSINSLRFDDSKKQRKTKKPRTKIYTITVLCEEV